MVMLPCSVAWFPALSVTLMVNVKVPATVGVPPKTADAIVTENANARIDGLRSSLSLLAIIALIALFATRRIPARQPSASPASEPEPDLA